MEAKARKEEVKEQKTGKGILLFFVLFYTLVSSAFGQKVVVTISADKKEIAQDERVTLTVTSNVQGNIKIDYPTEFEVDMGIMHGMEQKMDASGKIVSMYYVQQSGVFKKEGVFMLSASMNVQNKTYKSNKISIKVAEPSNIELSEIKSNDPIFGLIQSKKTTVYEGEPVVLYAKVFSYLDINYLEAYIPFKPSTCMEKHDFPNKKVSLEQTRINGKNALTFEYGKQVFIPISTGKSIVKPFEMALRCPGSIFAKTYKIRSAGITINVKPLPSGAPKSFIGLVGKYELKQNNPSATVKEGDVITLELTVSGYGNLHNSNPPKLILPAGCSIYGDPERKDNFTFTENGAEGTILYRYNIQINTNGEIHFPTPTVTYFDPEKEVYVTLKGSPFELNVNASPNMQVKSENKPTLAQEGTSTFSPLTSKKIEQKNTGSKLWIVGIAAPTGLLGLLFVLFFMRKNKREKSEEHHKRSSCRSLCTEEIQLHNEPISPAVIPTNYWNEALANQSNCKEFALLFPKAVIQRYSTISGCTLKTRDEVYQHLYQSAPELADRFKLVFNKCDGFCYNYQANELETEDLIQEINQLFEQIQTK